jgi:putative peptidoglycan lipid II flippase
MLFHHIGVEGLAIASDIGILAHTIALAILLHRARLVSIVSLDFPELARTSLAAIVAFVITQQIVVRIPLVPSLRNNLILIALGTVIWAPVTVLILTLLRSTLLNQLKNRKAAA